MLQTPLMPMPVARRHDWLAFCHSVALTAAVAGRDTVALYVRSLHTGRCWQQPLSATG
ncbi:hypothetical protein [Klebsiella pneumoniae]|uniref:hypothetical protein n=1 Tax=Klebsiella pneumoniae TaxID=573 RepID=UPI0029493F68|nr:hypothetical protein [Klebsiella pneumoniae]MDV5312339.1 hypothetical protein [Klebsiella pneumoniae]